MTRKLAIILPLLLFVAFVAVAIFGLERPANEPIASGMVGEPVPDFKLDGLNSAHPGLAASDLRQGTVTLVNLFGSWCLPCRIEAPQLERLREGGAVLHAIAIRDTQEGVEGFLADNGDPFSRIGMDPRGRMQIEFGATGVPETFLIDGNGIIRKQWIGDIRPEQVDEILAEMKALK